MLNFIIYTNWVLWLRTRRGHDKSFFLRERETKAVALISVSHPVLTSCPRCWLPGCQSSGGGREAKVEQLNRPAEREATINLDHLYLPLYLKTVCLKLWEPSWNSQLWCPQSSQMIPLSSQGVFVATSGDYNRQNASFSISQTAWFILPVLVFYSFPAWTVGERDTCYAKWCSKEVKFREM